MKSIFVMPGIRRPRLGQDVWGAITGAIPALITTAGGLEAANIAQQTAKDQAQAAAAQAAAQAAIAARQPAVPAVIPGIDNATLTIGAIGIGVVLIIGAIVLVRR